MNRKFLLPLATLGLLLFGVSGEGAWPLARRMSSTPVKLISPRQAPSPAAPVTAQEPIGRKEGSSSEVATVSAISISTGPNGETFVDIATTQQGSYRVTELENPRRLVVDFEGARKGLRKAMFSADSSFMTGVRVGQFQLHPAVVRVVADLLGDPKYDVHARVGGVRIELSSRGTTATEASVAPKPEVQKVVAPAAETLPSTAKVMTPPVLPVPTAAEGTLPTPVAIAQAPASLKAAPALAPESMRSEHAAEVLSASLPSEDQGQAGATTGTPEPPKYTGEPISVNLKDVDLKDFFRLIHEISGLNIIIDPNVTGSVTMVLDNVPWDQALDIVMRNNGLGKVLEGNVLRIARVDTLTAEQAANAKLIDARIDAQPLVTKFLPVNYAKAATVAGQLKNWTGGGGLSKRGNVLVDDRTNTLVVSDIATQIPLITDIVTKLDRKTRQVSIEARVVQATTLFERDLSGALQAAGFFGRTTGTGASSGPSSTATASSTPGGLPSIVGSFPGGTGFGVWGISSAGSHYAINSVLAADETNNRAKVISSPTIVTQDNTPGTVIQGVEVPVTTSINNTVTTQLVQASLQMTVTPHVTQDGNIFLVINVNNASLVGVSAAGPTINQQQATTQVLVPDGATVIIGGVKVDNTFYNSEYVPWLGQLPILGHLFKQTKNHNDTVDLLFFVTPKLLPS
jgi:type IV pilus secretin PilQ/predicted competence protein